jgi:hypothetical protein
MKVIQETPDYVFYEDMYGQLPITFRKRKENGNIQVMLDSKFAKANGYRNMEAMLNETHGNIGEVKKVFHGMPKWATVTEQGKFYLIPNELEN